RHRLRARDHGGVLRPDGAREPGARGARRRDGYEPSRLDLWLLPAAEKVLALARGHALGGTEADALLRARHDRAAPAAADRRADQGACARDHRCVDRLPQGSEAPRRHHPAGGAEFPRRPGARRYRRRDGQRPRRPHWRDGRACGRRGAAAPAAGLEPGYASMSATDTTPDAGAALPKTRRDVVPLLLPLALALVALPFIPSPSTWVT